MKPDAEFAAERARSGLAQLIERAKRDHDELLAEGDIVKLATFFFELRSQFRALADALGVVSEGRSPDSLGALVEEMNSGTIPTTFDNRNVRSLKIDGVGNVIIAAKWYASMIEKLPGMNWLRGNQAEGLIQPTVNAQTLASFAKERAGEGKPLPYSVFNVGTKPYVSIRRI